MDSLKMIYYSKLLTIKVVLHLVKIFHFDSILVVVVQEYIRLCRILIVQSCQIVQEYI